jgi:class 3 adenylate cyclase/tetratricopeptide (TPR) repeat protein
MERRVVTALFIDVVGSTALIVQLGSERFKRALDQGFLALRALIEAEGGSVGTSIGDAIFALFGVPAAHPDDPQRALRAAQACIRWSEASGTTSVPLAVRVGVETGEAIVDLAGAETERQQTSVGACVNLAARLQQLAEPGQILVGPTCHQITAEQAGFAALGEIEFKGLGRQPAWRLVALAGSPGSASPPLVGRNAELELLRLAYRQALSGRTVLAVIHGPPGQGKTRLVEEFVTELDDQAKVLKARCRPAGELGTRSPLRDLLMSDDGASSAEVLADRLVALFPDALERHRVFTALAHSVGLIVAPELSALPAGQRQDEIENGWRRYLGALARAHPLVLWVDDLHWAEGEIVSLLDRLTLATDLPLLILATARPEFATQAGWQPGDDRIFICLDALNDTDALALARHAGRADPTGIERAEGNPLFIIELARARKVGAEADLPLTLKGIIGARLDELPKQDRELLQRVAVVGETFTVEDAILLSGRKSADVQETLDRLADRLYLRRVPGGLRFHHALVHDVAYGRLTTAERMQLHARFAQAGVPPEDAEALAHHLWEAVGAQDAAWVWEGSEALSDLRISAREAHLAAARRYADRFACERAIEACRRALSFATEAKEVARVEQALGEVFAAKGDADQAWAHYLRALDSYKETGLEAPPDLYPSVLELQIYTSGMFVHPPDGALVEALLQEGEAIARRAGDAAALARLLALRAYEVHDAAQLSDALRLTEAVSDPRSLGSLLDHAAILQVRAGEFADALRSYQRLDTLAAASGLAGEQLEFRGILALNIGDLAEAEALAERFRAASASRGPHLQTHAHREQCHVLLAQGNWRGLCELAAETERLVARHPETNFCYAVTAVLASAVIAHAVEGRRAEARALLGRAEQMLQAEPEERESVLLLANGVAARLDRVAELRRQVREGATPPFWFFKRMEAVVLTMLERWDEVDETLPLLERVAKKGSRYLEALVRAIREEKAAALGGPAPTHRMLRELGYRGWSQLLSYRPEAL